jgi:hypothetical protein
MNKFRRNSYMDLDGMDEELDRRDYAIFFAPWNIGLQCLRWIEFRY